MKILSWNINGIRAIKPPIKELIKELDADIFCLQETKVTRDQLDEPTAIIDGYNSYFSFCRGRSGYSGVATFVRDSCTPIRAEEGLTGLLTPDAHEEIPHYGNQSNFSDEELEEVDKEGRVVLTQHTVMDSDGHEKTLTLINVYCPRADRDNADRLPFKMRLYRLLQIRAQALLKAGSHVIVLGDINMPHTKLDHCEPEDDEAFFGHPGRKWLSEFLWQPDKSDDDDERSAEPTGAETSFVSDSGNSHQFVDSFRMYHPDRPEAYTCWETWRNCRATNYGVRIDYILPDLELFRGAFSHCDIFTEVQGSDHCPVIATMDWKIIPAKKCPPLCTKYFPQFSGKQKKLSSFFTKKLKTDCSKNVSEECDSTSASQEPKRSEQTTVSQDGTSEVQKDGDKANQPAKRIIADSPDTKGGAKKIKKDVKASNSGGKQGSLFSFFSKPSKDGKMDGKIAAKNETSVEKTKSEAAANSAPSQCKESSKQEKSSAGSKDSSIASWKSLLSGPPPPPLCSGHKEACVLRTVKRQSKNKGRQFWVCPRPDGSKTNKEARCDTFMWITKK